MDMHKLDESQWETLYDLILDAARVVNGKTSQLSDDLARYKPRVFPAHVPPRSFERWDETNESWEFDQFDHQAFKHGTTKVGPFLWRKCVDPPAEALAELAAACATEPDTP